MPVKNALKIQAPDSYYHVFARGNDKHTIFRCDDDLNYFIHLIERYLSNKEVANENNRIFPNFKEGLVLLAYCLMPNHFHLLIYQNEVPALEKFMHSLMTSYSRYLNLKYKQSGPVFESRYKAVMIENESYLLHISRYIHLNPENWRNYRYSSLRYYAGHEPPGWIDNSKITGLFSGATDYLRFISDYTDTRDSLKAIKHSLADR